LIEIAGLEKSYGDVRALDGVTFEVHPGEIVGLLGANGAGKSTLLRTATGLQPADAGVVRIAGVDLARDPVAAKSRLGYAAEEPVFYEELSAGEYLAFVAGVRGLDPTAARDRVDALAARYALAGRLDEPVAHYSHGMRKKLSFIAAVLHRPAALLCDEALEGFDAASNLAAKEELRALAAAGTAILFSSHVTETIERVCDRAVLLHRGRVARRIDRAEWGAPPAGISPLESAFLEVVRGDAADGG
jgi:ABC-2 type transport system ATP-binding protein